MAEIDENLVRQNLSTGEEVTAMTERARILLQMAEGDKAGEVVPQIGGNLRLVKKNGGKSMGIDRGKGGGRPEGAVRFFVENNGDNHGGKCMGSDLYEYEKLDLDRARFKLDEARFRLDEYKATLEHDKSAMERAKLVHEGWRETFGATMRLAELALRSLLILNGGAALAMLSFAVNYSKQETAFKAGAVGPVVLIFGLGALLSVATTAIAYLTQLLYTQKWKWTPHVLRVVAIISGFGSLGFFGWGIYVASQLFH